MPVTVSPVAGDGVGSPALRAIIQLPDCGNTVGVQGIYVPPSIGQIPLGIISPVTFSGTGASPGVPGSGNNYWITELNTTTGVLSVKTSTSATPSPDAGNVTLFSQTIPSAAPAAISQQGNFFFPWLGTVSPS
ncbi:MAG: hypothetical protein ACLP53_21755 [Isosphaeraceae bacterium]